MTIYCQNPSYKNPTNTYFSELKLFQAMKNNKQIYKHGHFASENTSELQDIYDFDYKS